MASAFLDTNVSFAEASDHQNTNNNIDTDKKSIFENNEQSLSKMELSNFDNEEPVLINMDDYSNSSLLDMYDAPENIGYIDNEKDVVGTKAKNINSTSQISSFDEVSLPNNDEKYLNSMQNVTEYGFIIPNNNHFQEYSQWHNSKLNIESQRLQLFEKDFAKTVLNDNVDVTLDYQSKVYQFVVKNGIPAKYRFFLWTKYTNLNSYKEYKQMLDKYDLKNQEKIDIPDKEIIGNDLLRTFPSNIHFMRSPNIHASNLIATLEQQLSIFSILHKKDIGYCQSLNYLCGLVLLISPSNSDDNGYRRYELLNTIVMKIGISLYDNTLSGLKKFQETLLLLIYQYIPDLFEIIFEDKDYGEAVIDSLLEQDEENDNTKSKNKDLDLPVLMIYLSKWVLNCFINILPFEYCLRIIDLIILTDEEGITWIYKITLVLLDIAMNEFKKTNNYKNSGPNRGNQQSETKLKHSLSLKLNKVLNHNMDLNNSNSNNRTVGRKITNSFKKKQKVLSFHSNNGLEMEFLKLLTDLFQQENYNSLEFDNVILKRLQKSSYNIIDIVKVKNHLLRQRMTRKEKLKYRLKLKKID